MGRKNGQKKEIIASLSSESSTQSTFIKGEETMEKDDQGSSCSPDGFSPSDEADEESNKASSDTEDIHDKEWTSNSIDDKRTSSLGATRSRKHYTDDFKLEAVSLAEEIGIRATSKKLKASRRSIGKWLQQKDKLLQRDGSKKTYQRYRGLCVQAEEKLVTWYKSKGNSGIHVSHNNLKKKALLTYVRHGFSNFKASDGWLRRFLKRHGKMPYAGANSTGRSVHGSTCSNDTRTCSTFQQEIETAKQESNIDNVQKSEQEPGNNSLKGDERTEQKLENNNKFCTCDVQQESQHNQLNVSLPEDSVKEELSDNSACSDVDSDSVSSQKKKVKHKCTSYDKAFKMKVIAYAEETSNYRACKKFGIARKNVQRWREAKNKIGAMPETALRMAGSGRKSLQIRYPDAEKEVCDWVLKCKESHQKVTKKALQFMAYGIMKKHGCTDFRSSHTWMKKFIMRNSLSNIVL